MIKLVDDSNLNLISLYARFILQNIGYSFYSKKTNKLLNKWEIYITIEHKEDNITVHRLNLIYSNEHPLYGRRKR